MEEWRKNKPPEDETVIVTVKDDTADRPYYYTSTGWYFKELWVVDNAPCSQVTYKLTCGVHKLLLVTLYRMIGRKPFALVKGRIT